MAEIQEIQEDIMTGLAINGMSHPQTHEEGLLHISKMRSLLEKQKNFMFRLSLEKEDADALDGVCISFSRFRVASAGRRR